jgi:hypothetical protein
VALLALLVSGMVYEQRVRTIREVERATTLVEGLEKAAPGNVPLLLEELKRVQDAAEPLLRQRLAENSGHGPLARLRARQALLARDSSQAAILAGEVLQANPEEVAVLRDLLRPHRETAAARL